MNKEQSDPRDYPRVENLEHMSQHMQQHEIQCVTCSHFKQSGFKTRCAEYSSMKEIQAFWRKRVKAR